MNRKRIILLLFITWLTTGYSFAQRANVFIENIGQYPASVKYYSPFSGGVVFVESTGLTYFLNDPATHKPGHNHDHRSIEEPKESYAYKVNFLATGSGQQFSGSPSTTTFNYFYGNDPDKWISGARSFTEVNIEKLYPGIDLQLSWDGGAIKYDLILDAGADPTQVKMKYAGVEDLQVNEDGSLKYTIPYMELSEQIPLSYALCESESRVVNSSFKVDDDIVSFAVEEVDQAEQLVIDPLLVFSTYSGSPSDNWGNTATFDDEGNAYAGGITTTTRGGVYLGEFPTTPGVYQENSAGGWDVTIMKYDSAGTNLLYATHLGGGNSDVPQSLIVDENGDLLILGVTGSANFPTSSNAFDDTFNGGDGTSLISGIQMLQGIDLFVAKLSNDGSELLGSTYFGGSQNDGFLAGFNLLARNYGDESRGDINFDSKGNILIASRTSSNDFPVTDAYDNSFNGNTDAVVLKLTPNLDSLVWSTFLGGGETDIALSIKIDQDDNICTAGGTSSVDFPTTTDIYRPFYGGDVDGWVAWLSSDGDSLLASTYIGTEAYDQAFFLDLDAEENVYLAGQTTAAYPVTPGKFYSGRGGQFIHKLSKDLKQSVFSTVIGSPNGILPNISLTAFLVNECDNIYLSGWGSYLNQFNDGNNFTSMTTGLPVTFDALQPVSDGSSFYLAVLSGDASELLYGTHLGSTSSYVHVDGGTSRFDKNGIVYHSVCASCDQDDTSFPTTDGAYAEINASSGCSNAIFKFDLASLRARLQTNNIELTDPGLNSGCLPLAVVFENNTTGGQVYDWNFGDGSKRTVYTKDTVLHYYKNPGTFRVQLRAYDPNTCIAEDWAYTEITVAEPLFSFPEDVDICSGSSTRLIANGGTSYEWSPAEGLDNPNSGSPIASPIDTTTYTVRIFNTNGCSAQGSVTVNVIPAIIPKLKVEQANLCEGSREIRLSNESENADTISWSLGDGTVIDTWEGTHEYATDGNYTVTATLRREKCVEGESFNLNILELNVPNVLTRNNDGYNEVFRITAGSPVSLNIYTRWGTRIFEAADYQNDWSGEGLRPGIYFYEVIMVNGEVCSGWVQLLNDG